MMAKLFNAVRAANYNFQENIVSWELLNVEEVVMHMSKTFIFCLKASTFKMDYKWHF
jgi:hypothetical protein